MDRTIWAGLATFAAIVEAGSFTKAAGRLGVSASALSHAMRTLETQVGLRLLNRTTRSVAPTAAGEMLLARLRPAMGDVETALEALNAQRDRPAGRVRISAHRTAAVHAVLPRLQRFAQDFPEIEIELAIEDGLVDIVAGRFDCGIRHEQMLQQDMIAVRLGGPQRVAFVAAPAYLARHGTPEVPEDLRRHRCLQYRMTTSAALYQWQFVRDGRVFGLDLPASFVSNDVDVILEAALEGIGIACVSESQAVRHLASAGLVALLDAYRPSIPPNYLYYPSRQQPTAAFTAFVAAMRAG